MSISQEWMKLTRNVSEFLLAFRTGLWSTWIERRTKKATPHTIHIRFSIDSRMLAELERRRSLALLNNTRMMVR